MIKESDCEFFFHSTEKKLKGTEILTKFDCITRAGTLVLITETSKIKANSFVFQDNIHSSLVAN